MDTASFPLKGESISLVQAVKAVGLADTGGQAKYLVREGTMTVNGEPENRPGRKLVAGDRFSNGVTEWILET